VEGYIGVTDNDWFDFLAHQPEIDEVNFWQPGGRSQFKSLQPGEPFLFKLHSPLNYITGGGFFAHHTIIPVSMAWQAFGEKNGASSYLKMRRLIERNRHQPPSFEDYHIGCIILTQPFFSLGISGFLYRLISVSILSKEKLMILPTGMVFVCWNRCKKDSQVWESLLLRKILWVTRPDAMANPYLFCRGWCRGVSESS